MTTTTTSGAATQRYKIGYHADEWGQRSSTPSGIPDASGSWVRYEDHVTALAAGQATAAQQGAYAALSESFLEIPDVQDESGINAYYSREVVLECIDAALASHGQAPAGAGMGHTDGGRNMFYEGRFDGESQREQQARLRWANDMRAAFERHTGNGWFDKDWRTETGLWSSAWHACLAAQPTTTAQAAPAYKDSAPELHIGDSAFESWYGTYNPAHKADKQRARDTYEAGWKAGYKHGAWADTPPADSVQEDALSDSVRTPLDSLHADAAYLIGRLRDGSMPYVRVIEIIRERIDAAKAATHALRASHGQAPAGAAQADSVQEDAARYRWLRRWKGQEHEPPFTVQHEIAGTLWGGDLDAAIDADRKQGTNHD